jgi:hypothetical protein
VGGRDLPYAFWRAALELEPLVAIKVAPFDRYRTLDVVRAVWDAGRGGEVALYTGNDDHILLDLLTPFRFGEGPPLHIVGGLLGQWAVWTARAVGRPNAGRSPPGPAPPSSDGGAAHRRERAIFDAAHRYAGASRIHEVRRQGGRGRGAWHGETSPGQARDCPGVAHRT